ncbi:MAG: [FeFe] hydrogenase H-cluster radical SAM maturase HydG [Candidatus Neomarinimicrobiota bacterium]|nr:MAG: [FeFe] hydrogenase H-cluster radical SAM maturase HydG [Candidatus Neomarinimicrobiota bacterium]
MYELSKNAMDFINDEYLEGLLKNTKPDEFRVREILDKSLSKEPLNVEETAVLLNAEDRELQEEILETARKLKREVYGNRIVLFAPLYIGNYCINNCQYCGFRISNRNAVRRTLTDDEVKEQVIALESKGHKRLILVWGEHPMYSPEQIAKTVRIVYSTKSGKGEIRRVNINAAPQTVEGYKIIKEAGIGTFQVFQETYHHETYKKFHPGNTPKSDYLYRLDALDRAMEGGIDDVGIGALFGLYNWKFEVLGLVSHAIHLQKKYGVGPHTISFPRIRPALGVEMDYPYIVNDEDFKRMVAILRISVPYTGLILTAREKPELRREVMAFGVSQIDAGSRIEIGGYTEAGDAQSQYIEKEQFELGDIRPLDVVMRELMQDEYVPSFCTACYRIGRTGEHFMEFAIPGFIKRFCTPNALLTLMEYLVDYASEETREVGENLIKKELEKMDDDGIKKSLIERLDTIKTTNKRDLYY